MCKKIWNGIPKLAPCVKHLIENCIFLRHLKRCKIPVTDLITIYLQYIPPTLKYASPAWFGGLSKTQKECLEKMQRKALHIIFTVEYCRTRSYSDICRSHNIPVLCERLELLSLNFGNSLLNSKTYREWLPPYRNNNLRNTGKLSLIRCRTNRYQCSLIPFLTKILNQH